MTNREIVAHFEAKNDEWAARFDGLVVDFIARGGDEAQQEWWDEPSDCPVTLAKRAMENERWACNFMALKVRELNEQGLAIADQIQALLDERRVCGDASRTEAARWKAGYQATVSLDHDPDIETEFDSLSDAHLAQDAALDEEFRLLGVRMLIDLLASPERLAA